MLFMCKGMSVSNFMFEKFLRHFLSFVDNISQLISIRKTNVNRNTGNAKAIFWNSRVIMYKWKRNLQLMYIYYCNYNYFV